MTNYFIILSIAITYALIRAKQDIHLRKAKEGSDKWKPWAETLVALTAGVVSAWQAHSILSGITLFVIFGITFSLVFDIAIGYLFSGKLLYFGSGKYDQAMQKIFIRPLGFIFFKSMWLLIISGFYFAML